MWAAKQFAVGFRGHPGVKFTVVHANQLDRFNPYAFITFSLCGVDSIYAKVKVDYLKISVQETSNQISPER